MCSDRSDTPLQVPGFPIRTSTDQSLVGSSPWLFAATHVLHRCPTPSHPPLALGSLEELRCSCSLCSSQGARWRLEAAPRHEDAGAATEWPSRRRLEVQRPDGRSLKTEDRTVRLAQVAPSGGNTFDRRDGLDQTERGSNWESSLRCAGTLTP